MNYTQFCESVKSDELDRVLDKINKKLTLTDSENSFLKNYHNLKDTFLKDGKEHKEVLVFHGTDVPAINAIIGEGLTSS